MFDGEIMKKKFTLKNFLDVDNFCPRQSPRQSPKQSKTRVQNRVKDKLGVRKCSPNFFFFLQKALKCHI